MTSNFEHGEVFLGFKIDGLPPMTRVRSVRERFFSWPWRPWRRVVPTQYALMLKSMEYTQKNMADLTGVSSLLRGGFES